MIMRTAVTVIVAVCLVVSNSAATAAKADHVERQPAEAAAGSDVQQQQNADAGIDINVTALAARFIQDYVTPTICSYSPSFCAKHQLQSRGIQSYLATAGTLFAGVLGIILTKIKILVVVSLLTMITGKLLLFYAFLKSDHYHHHSHHKPHHHHVPFVKYTKDKYYIKHTPVEHSHDVIVDSPPPHSPYHGHAPSGVSYYKR